MFKKTNNFLLVLSIALSIKTICFVTLKTISIQKPFLPVTSKLVLMLWVVISSSVRVMSIVLFFTPSFGLFSTLGHWKLEETPYSDALNSRFKTDNLVYLYNSEPIAWANLNRYSNETSSISEYSVYTYFSLTEYFCGFWILLCLQTFTNFLAKIVCSKEFRKNWTSYLFSSFIHCLENVNIATVWMDWDERKGSIEVHKKRHRRVVIEMVVIIIIRSIYHAVMLAPIVYTG